MIGLTAVLAILSELAKISINFRFRHFPLHESLISELAFDIIIRVSVVWLFHFQKYWSIFIIPTMRFLRFKIKFALPVFLTFGKHVGTYGEDVTDLLSILSFLLFQVSDSTI